MVMCWRPIRKRGESGFDYLRGFDGIEDGVEEFAGFGFAVAGALEADPFFQKGSTSVTSVAIWPRTK